MDGTDSGSCPVTSFGISCAEFQILIHTVLFADYYIYAQAIYNLVYRTINYTFKKVICSYNNFITFSSKSLQGHSLLKRSFSLKLS